MKSFLSLLFWCFSLAAYAQLEIRQGETIVCQVGSVTGTDQNKWRGDKPLAKIGDEESIFDVKYSGFTEEAKAAFQYAVDIWSRTIKTDVKIRVFANWAFLDNTTTLAFVTPTEVKNFVNAPTPNLWYPIALAEKIGRVDINATTEADIVATFNSRRDDWYFGIDGNCPSNKLDLVTVVLHELGHGLGISGTFRVSNSNGFYGMTDGNPKIYDEYLRNGLNAVLLDFTSGTAELANQLTSNSIVFNSPIAKLLSGTPANPRVYAPSPYNPGSSISHLDQGTYTNTQNSLMTPFAESGKVAHDCGPLIRGMLYEMGWLNTWLEHSPLVDQENLEGTKFILNIRSDTALLTNSVKLRYSYNAFSASNEVEMQPTDQLSFEAEIPEPLSETTIHYYFESQDVLGRKYRDPINPTAYHSFYHGLDVIKPSIVHTVPEDIIQFKDRLEITAIVTDNIAVASVELNFKKNDGTEIKIPMTTLNGVDYSYLIDLSELTLQQGDQINYYIIARDASIQSNESRFPATGSATINVLTFTVKDIYTSNLNADLKEFFGDFDILKPVGFLDGAIHSPHPYPKATTEPLDLSYVLLFPIRIKEEDSYLTFDEVVLIEPGTGDDHTTEAFGDYVIVEGSDNDGQTWIPLESGYDSRKFPEWLNYYNSDIRNGDSRSIGTLNYFKHHQIDLLNIFEQGDIVNIRFRLHSNSQNVGWGWAIDNLKIQDQILSTDDLNLDIALYPNPVKDKFRLSGEEKVLSIHNTLGLPVMSKIPRVNNEFDLSTLSSGVYLVKVASGRTLRFIRIIKE